METIDPVETTEVDPSQILYDKRDRTVVLEPANDVDSQELDKNTSQHDLGENNETDG